MKSFARLSIRLAFSLGLATFAQAQSASNDDLRMSALFDGPPALASTVLDPSAYVEEQVQKLSRAQIAYVNWEAIDEILKELGFEKAPRKLTPALAQAILDRAGFAKPLPGESASAYSQSFRKLYSIRYGGRWINYNFGSGRNGATGKVDIKGIGKTILVRPWADSGHSSGGMGLEEAIKEAIWSNILHNELPLGANRVLFIMTTGTLINPNDPNSEQRAILVREDPVRPAYFQPNDGVKQFLMSDELREMHTAADNKRMQMLIPKLVEALPKSQASQADMTPAQALNAGMFEMADRIAHQYAIAYTKQIVLAGGSTSNVEINGVALDYGVTTSIAGFPKVSLLSGEAPHGSTETLKNDIVIELAQDLRPVLPPELLAGMPSDEALGKRLDAQFERSLLQGFLELVGTPKEYSGSMISKSAGKNLGIMIKKIAQAGNEEPVQWRHEGMPYGGRFRLDEVLTALVKNQEAALETSLPDNGLRLDLQKDFSAFRKELRRMAMQDGISAESLQQYMEIAVSSRNRSLTQVRSGKSFFDEIAVARKRFSADSPDVIQNFVNRTVARNSREFKGRKFQLTVNDNNVVSLARGMSTRKVFDLKTGRLSKAAEPLMGLVGERVLSPRAGGISCEGIF